jgi:hypothetical protein
VLVALDASIADLTAIPLGGRNRSMHARDGGRIVSVPGMLG